MRQILNHLKQMVKHISASTYRQRGIVIIAASLLALASFGGYAAIASSSSNIPLWQRVVNLAKQSVKLGELSSSKPLGLSLESSMVTPAAPSAALTPGNLVIYRMGDGAAALTANGTAVFLDEYTTAGAFVQSIAVPTTTVGAQRRLVCSGTATTEGFLTRSTDGQYVVFSGYDAALATASITSSTSAAVPRVIGRLAGDGTLDTTTALTDAISGGNPRSTAATTGTDLWLSGTSTGGGIRYATLGATTSTSLATTPTNLRALGIFGGQLYTSSQSGAFRLATIGTGTPTTAGQTITNLPGFPTSSGSPYGFFFADLDAGVAGPDTVYVADDGGTIQKYSLVAGNWTANGTIAQTTARGLTGTVSGSTVTLYITARTLLRTLTDTSGYNATITGTPTTLATAATNTAFQGVAFAPVANGPNLSINDVSLNEGNAGTTSFTFTVSLSAPAGPGGVTFDIATADNTATQPSDYTQKSLTSQTIPAGSSTYSFTVLVNGDTTPETNETFFVNVTNVTGATVTDGQGQGTIVNDDAAPNLTINDVSLNEGNAGTTTFTFTVSLSAPAGAGGVTFDIATANNSAVAPGDYTAKSLTSQTIPAGSSTYTFDVLVNGDTTPETDETFFVNVTNITNAIGADTQGQGTIVNDDITKIHDVQGNGAATPIPGSTVTVEGVVVANFQGTSKLQGFFLEEEDADFDADPATSEGIFIFCNSCPTPVAEGQRVKATGVVSEFNNLTEITASTAGSVVITNAGNNLAQVTPSTIDLPIVGVIDDFYEAREGMKVTFVDALTVSEYFELGRYGQIELFEGGRPRQFTEMSTPSMVGYNAHLDNLNRRRVVLDDDNNRQNAYLPAFGGPADGLQFVFYPQANGGFSFGTQGTDFFRGGDVINSLTGVLHWSFAGQTGTDAWRIRPTAANPATFTVANPRPVTPPAVGGAIKAAGMNMLNYFTTIDTTASSSTGPCGPGGTQDCRGADSVAELNRQRERASIVICSINADVYGLMEMENTTASATINDLLGAVNTRCGGAHPYAFVNTGGTLGTDAIRVNLIYRTGILSPVGAALVDLDSVHNRPPTAQTFDVVDATNPAFGERFTVIANHFKSKGCPGTGADADAGDGAGCFNGTRTAQATRLLSWINSTVLPAAGDPDVLLLGDFNSYAKEDPVTTLISGGYADLETLLLGSAAYSYLFDGQLGHLDYAFSSTSLTSKVIGVASWHINADEVSLLDYNDEVFDSPGESNFEEKPDGSALVPPRVVFQPATPYRAADHDPVLVGLFSTCTVVCPANITLSAAAGQCSAVATFAPTTGGSCNTVTCTPASGSAFNVGITTVTCSQSGGTPSCSFTVTVNDTQNPTVICPTNIVTNTAAGQCSATVNYTTPSASDNCPGATVVCSPASGTTFQKGVTTVTCTATDASNLTGTCTFTVTVNDNQAPTVACPSNISTNTASGQCSAAVTYTTPTASDNCAGATVSCSPASGTTFQKGVTTVTCTATDASKLTGSCTFTVTVVDNQAPTVACPANITTNAATGSCAATVTYTTPTASDNCTGATVSCSPASGSSFAKGVTTVTCTATDASNLISTCGFTVTVNDNQLPTISCPTNQSVGSLGSPVTVNYPAPTASDNCPGVTTTCTPAAGSSFPVGVTTVSCTAKDAVNNMSAACTFTVTVIINQFTPAPTASLTDPLACTGPGNSASGSFAVTNTSQIAQSGTITTALPMGLVGIPGTCTVNVGSCTVSANSVVWTGTLNAGQSVTASYQAQIGSVPTGTQLCAVTTAVFGQNTGSVQACLTVNCPSPGPGAVFPSAAEASDQKTGSILIYNVYTSGATSGNTQNTRINITNTHMALPAYVHLFFIAENCGVADSYICLTANQTASFLANDLDPGTTGYIMAVATNNIGCPINFNYLIGDEYVKFTTGHAANLAAQAFAALPGGLPPCDGNTVITSLNFDGVSYNRAPATLALDNIASRADGNDTLLILNRVGGNLGLGTSTLGTLFGILYNDAENAVSFSVNGSCQLRSSLSNNFPRTTPRFDSFIAAGRTGWLKIYEQTGSVGLVGAAINFNPNATATAGAFNQGHNLHVLTLTSGMSYILPVFPPNC